MPKYRRKLGHLRKDDPLDTVLTNTNNFTNSKRMTPEQSEIQRAVKYADRRADEMAQHGPVRVLWRNGKPVGQSL